MVFAKHFCNPCQDFPHNLGGSRGYVTKAKLGTKISKAGTKMSKTFHTILGAREADLTKAKVWNSVKQIALRSTCFQANNVE